MLFTKLQVSSFVLLSISLFFSVRSYVSIIDIICYFLAGDMREEGAPQHSKIVTSGDKGGGGVKFSR